MGVLTTSYSQIGNQYRAQAISALLASAHSPRLIAYWVRVRSVGQQTGSTLENHLAVQVLMCLTCCPSRWNVDRILIAEHDRRNLGCFIVFCEQRGRLVV